MKVIKHKTDPMDLDEFAKNYKFPYGLVLHRHTEGYGSDTYIEQCGTGINLLLYCTRARVALIGFDSISLYHPEWFSDIERFVMDYEKYNKSAEVTIEVFDGK